MKSQKTSAVTYAVFIFALAVVLISLSSVLFPSLIIALTSGQEIDVEPFDQGPWLIPVLTVNLVLLGLGILYYKKILPKPIRSSFEFIFNFEVSKTVAIFVVVAILFGYIGFSMEDLAKFEGDTWGDFAGVEKIANEWTFNDGTLRSLELLHVKNFFLKSSIIIFQNIRVIPFLATISMLLLTYFFTAKIAKKRFAGIIAMIFLVQSYSFNLFDSLSTYANFWVLFFLLSLYLVDKKWFLSPISYVASLFSKPLTFAYLPMLLFFVYRSDLPRRKKILLVIPYFVMLGAIPPILLSGGSSFLPFGAAGGFDYHGFWSGFSLWPYQLRFEGLFLALILPVTVGLFLISSKGMTRADSILFLIAGIIFAIPLMAGFTGWNLHPYRFVPLLVFFAIGVGTLFSRRSFKQ